MNTLFLDAGGVLCHPSWTRISAALATEGVSIAADALRPPNRSPSETSTRHRSSVDHG